MFVVDTLSLFKFVFFVFSIAILEKTGSNREKALIMRFLDELPLICTIFPLTFWKKDVSMQSRASGFGKVGQALNKRQPRTSWLSVGSLCRFCQWSAIMPCPRPCRRHYMIAQTAKPAYAGEAVFLFWFFFLSR